MTVFPLDSSLPAPPPLVNRETEEFWSATNNGVLLVPQCRDCDFVFWYPRRRCPLCRSTGIAMVPASGRGSVYSYAVTRQSFGAYATATPYVLAYIELQEGPCMLSNIVGVDPADVFVGQRVGVVFSPTSAGNALPRFQPV